MDLSASKMGRPLGLTGEEFNRLLVHQGYLEGNPNAYGPTAKGAPFVVETSHELYGGYAKQNWETRVWDDAILPDLTAALTPELKVEIATDLKEARRAAREARYAPVAVAEPVAPSVNPLHAQIRNEIRVQGVGLLGQVALVAIQEVTPRIERLLVDKVAPAVIDLAYKVKRGKTAAE